MRFLIYLGCFLTGICLVACRSQKVVVSYSPEEITKAVDTQSYQFLARFVQPASGRTREITGGGYFLRVTKEKVSANLPYFGRAYSAPIGTDGGIKFETTQFEHRERTNKKGAREVTISVSNSPVVRELNLTVFPDGNADLRITPQNRRFISYRGEVTPMVN